MKKQESEEGRKKRERGKEERKGDVVDVCECGRVGHKLASLQGRLLTSCWLSVESGDCRF